MKIDIPNHLKHLDFLDVIFDSRSPMLILALGENIKSKGKKPAIIRLYLCMSKKGEFIVQCELEAFQFGSADAADSFIKRLPTMNAIELLLIKAKFPTAIK